MKQHIDVQTAINKFKAGMIVEVLDVKDSGIEEITIHEPEWYVETELESINALELADFLKHQAI